MRYIDYLNGGMGNTILAHILYSCNLITCDVNDIFNSTTGDSHAIGKVNHTSLRALHLALEEQDHSDECILQVIIDKQDLMLVHKFSYEKWHKSYPTASNYMDFNIRFDVEITPQNFLEFLTINFFDRPKFENTRCKYKINLRSYHNNELSSLHTIANELGYEWDNKRSRIFYNKMLEINQPYFDWSDNMLLEINNNIKIIPKDVNVFISNNPMALWEQALIISGVCQKVNIHPSSLNWI